MSVLGGRGWMSVEWQKLFCFEEKRAYSISNGGDGVDCVCFCCLYVVVLIIINIECYCCYKYL